MKPLNAICQVSLLGSGSFERAVWGGIKTMRIQ